jgi:hypothetical protein
VSKQVDTLVYGHMQADKYAANYTHVHKHTRTLITHACH